MIYILNQTYSDMSMRYIILTIAILLSFNSYCQEGHLPALRYSDSFSKPYRVLNTTISPLSGSSKKIRFLMGPKLKGNECLLYP